MRIVWDRLGTGSSCRGDIICSDPPLVKPATPTEMDKPVIDNFKFHPASGSPAVGRGISVNGITTDYYGNARPNQPSIGAAEPGR
jgi:hypothetical protein